MYSLTRIYFLEAYFELVKTLRTPSFVLPSLLFPVMFYLFFGVLFSPPGASNTSAYLLATYCTFGVMGPALFSFGAEVAVEKDRNMLALKQISPMPIFAYFNAKFITSAVFALIIILSLFTVAATLADVRLSTQQWLATMAVLLFGTLPFCALGLWLGLTLKAQSAPAVVNLIYLPMSFLSGLWIPLQLFPEFLQKMAFALPPYHLAQLTLKVQGLDDGHHWFIHLGALVFITGFCSIFAYLAFAKQSEA
ncbi:MAG: ABC transporter permease [Alteromonadaceae bacterium]|nr:ABC transporter permease [Alteromonadaceae bacterium]